MCFGPTTQTLALGMIHSIPSHLMNGPNKLQQIMRTSSKGGSEKRRLTQYVTNTVLDDNFKGTTEQFVLHFNEQFRQLDEISEDSEKLPSTVKLTLLQTAVRSIIDLRIVETLDEFQSTTYGHGSSTSLC